MSERIYIVVLRNLDLPDRKLCMTSGRIASHAVHVAAKLQRLIPDVDAQDKDIIILSVADNAELESLCQRLIGEGVMFVEYRDIDRVIDGEHLTAIATYPIEKNSSFALKHLRPWKCACNEVQVPRSSAVEHLTTSQEVADRRSPVDVGSSPAEGAK
jgi:hypothetical protein